MATVNINPDTGEAYIASERPAYDGSKPHNQQDYYLDNYGNQHHRYENVVHDEESLADPIRDDYETWRTETYMELYGGQERYSQMIAYAEQNWDELDIEAFNNIMDSDDPSKIEEALAHLNQMYEEFTQPGQRRPEPEEEDSTSKGDDEWFESLDDEILDTTVDELMENDITMEQSEQMSSLQTQYGADSPEYQILDVGQQVFNGDLEMSDAIELIIDQYGEATAARAYFELQNILANYY